MAMRHLRRIQEQASKAKETAKEPSQVEENEDDDEDNKEMVAGSAKKAPFNPFDLLSDEDEPSLEGGASEGEQDAARALTDAPADADPAEAPDGPTDPEPQSKPKPASSSNASKKAAAKKKKKQASKGSVKKADVDDLDAEGRGTGKAGAATRPGAGKGGGVEEDIDAILRELNLTPAGATASGATSASANGAGTASSTSVAAAGGAAGPSGSGAAAAGAEAAGAAASVLCVDVKGLRGDEELRRIFGSDVVAAVDKQDRAAAAEARRMGTAARGLPAGRRRGLALKRGWLVAPKEHWPACEGGLSMEMAGNKKGVPLFRYVHSPAYRETQLRFLRCQASYDPATIAVLLQQAPYHVDSLLAMHDLYRHMGENNFAEEMLDRALWTLEAAWHASFQPASAACRLDYEVEENRPLFGALFRHVQALSRRGCHRAALECCKLLLALEPEDPLGGLYLIDYLAVRAGRYDWLQRFVLQFEGNRSLALLPNYAFSLPMAAFRQQQQGQGQGAAASANGAGSSSSVTAAGGEGAGGAEGTAAARAQGGASSSSPHEQLVGALLLHPLVLPKLVARLQDKGVAKESYWKELLSRRLYSGASDGGSASLSHLVGLYVERSGELWKPPDLLALLRKAAGDAADVADGKVAPSDGISAADWRTVARESFPPSAANEYRHLRLADFSDAVNALPREEVEAAVQGGGQMQDVEEALAELQEQMILAQQRQDEAAAAGGGGGGAAAAGAAAAAGGRGGANAPMTDDQLRNANPLLMLLRSLLPWVNAGQQPDYAADDAAPAAARAGGGVAGAAAQQGQGRQAPPPPPPPPPPPLLEYDDDDGHLDDDEGVVRQVRR